MPRPAFPANCEHFATFLRCKSTISEVCYLDISLDQVKTLVTRNLIETKPKPLDLRYLFNFSWDMIMQACGEGWVDGRPHAEDLLFNARFEDLIQYKREGLIDGCIPSRYRTRIPSDFIHAMEEVGLLEVSSNDYITCVNACTKVFPEEGEECPICYERDLESVVMCRDCKKPVCTNCMIEVVKMYVTSDNTTEIPCPWCRHNMIDAFKM